LAKLKGPLFSLGASQQLGKTLVYFTWKGLNVVREYVVPSNPRTTAQQTQRGYLTAAVAKIHAAQAHDTHPLGATDISAYALWASVVQAATTWFNQVVRNWIDQKILAKIPCLWQHGSVTASSVTLKLMLFPFPQSSAPTDGDIFYGTSRTALINKLACTVAQVMAGKDITPLVAGTKYFLQYRPDTPGGFAGSNSGIYYGTPTA